MTDFTEQQIPEMARRVLAERDAGRSVNWTPSLGHDRLCVPDGEGIAMAMRPIEIVDNRVEMS